MTFNLNESGHKKLDDFLGTMLDGYKSGEFSKNDVIGALAHVFTAAMIDNEGEVISWIEKPETLKQWRADLDGTRS